jgi:hypothetical protein
MAMTADLDRDQGMEDLLRDTDTLRRLTGEYLRALELLVVPLVETPPEEAMPYRAAAYLAETGLDVVEQLASNLRTLTDTLSEHADREGSS